MAHEFDLILTLAGGLTAALVLGFATHKIGLSPIVGYLLAGIVVGPFTPGYVADRQIAGQFAEIGVVLLMFGVGLHFHLRDLLAVRSVAIPGALVQIAVATLLGTWVAGLEGWSLGAGIIYGIAISVASTVVLTRVLADNRALHTPAGHIAVGWLIVEDIFTVVVLVLLPAIFGGPESTWGGMVFQLVKAAAKIVILTAFTLWVGQKVIPKILGYVARAQSRELFTLTVLVLVLGIAVGAAELFGASMALGAFLAGMVIGQSDFSSRAASEALPMRDAFAVLFFVSVGMLFNPGELASSWRLFAATLGVILVGKPLAALFMVLLLRRPLGSAIAVAVSLAQVGEFSFILAGLGERLGVVPRAASNALVSAAMVSITLNPLLYRGVEPATRFLGALLSRRKPRPAASPVPKVPERPAPQAIVVGYGPVGRTLTRLLRDNGIRTVVIELNLETITALRAERIPAVYGDGCHGDTLLDAGILQAHTLVYSSSIPSGTEVIRVARELRPELTILARCNYLREASAIAKAGSNAVFSGEGEVALAMTAAVLSNLGATPEQIDRESDRVRRELF